MTNTNTNCNHVVVAIAARKISELDAACAASDRADREYFAAQAAYESNRTPENLMAYEAAAKEKEAAYAVWSSAMDAVEFKDEWAADEFGEEF